MTCGILAMVFVLFSSLSPSEEAKTEWTLEINLQNFELGEINRIDWLVPVVVYRPSIENMEELESLNSEVWSPDINKTDRPIAYVYVPNSTFQGCGLISISREFQLEYGWPRGWIDPCHIGGWDLAGRSFKSVNGYEKKKLDNLENVPFKMLKNGNIELRYPK